MSSHAACTAAKRTRHLPIRCVAYEQLHPGHFLRSLVVVAHTQSDNERLELINAHLQPAILL